MNKAFKHYGKQPEIRLARESLIVQSKYNLDDKQLAGLLVINEFFQRVVLMEVHITRVRINDEKLPLKTIEFFRKFNKCSDIQHLFTPITAYKSFSKFSDRVLNNINNVSDYVAEGLLSIEEEKHTEIVYEMVEND
jgi:hypothetical protein